MGAPLSKEAVDWAVESLIAGLDSPTLRVLAGLQEPLWWSEVESIFVKAASELGFAAPATEQDALWAYARQVGRDILDDRSAPEAACHTLYRICVALDYPHGLLVWDGLDTAWIDITEGRYPYSYEAATAANFAEICKNEARALLEGTAED
jgi:hypothetical protein